MHSMVDQCDKVQRVHTAVLMARLVDREGANLDPAAIRSIRYSLVELAIDRPGEMGPVAGHDGRRLRVPDVVYDKLRTSDDWSTDDLGYNFRHRFSFRGSEEPLRRRKKHYEIRYVMTHATGEESIVRFRVRMVST